MLSGQVEIGKMKNTSDKQETTVLPLCQETVVVLKSIIKKDYQTRHAN